MRYFLLISFSFCSLLLQAQPKYNQNWYFGKFASLTFGGATPAVGSDSKMNTYRSAASVSDESTGELQLYTNGNAFWNRFGELVDPAYNGGPVNDVLIIPLKAYKNRFAVFNFSDMYVLDMTARGGRGAVLEKRPMPLKTSVNRMTAVKTCLSEAYWLITIENNDFNAYRVHPDGRVDAPIVTAHPTLEIPGNYLGDFVSSYDGQRLAVTPFSPDAAGNPVPPQVFEFDKRCGTVAPSRVLLPMRDNWDRPHGISFSPDDRLIYVAYGYLESHLVQYDAGNPNINTLIATSPENFNQIACGPDGRLYITTHINGVPSEKIDVVHFPNKPGTACSYQERYLWLNGVSNFEVPNLILNHNGTCKAAPIKPPVYVSEGACTGQTIWYSYAGMKSSVDSLHWYYNDPASPGKYVNDWQTSYTYNTAGMYEPYMVWYYCGLTDTMHFKVKISDPQNFSIGPDTLICKNDSVSFGPFAVTGSYLWSTGDTAKSISVKKAGVYSVKINQDECISSDTIEVGIHPDIWTILGDRYYICEAEGELAEMHAGKGFKSYLWLPTNDTTEWIEVAKVGKYYVIVSDFTGCKAEDNAIVEQRCDLLVYIPNAFSPNADRTNDKFNVVAENAASVDLSIYNRWGQLIYKGNDGWDGTYRGHVVPQDVYTCVVSVNGFIKKQEVTKRYSGTVQVVY